jgi:hypothetical protein
MREVHWPAGPFNRLGEFPAEQPNDLPLSPTAGVLSLGPDVLATLHVFLALLTPQPNNVLYHSDHCDTDPSDRIRASHLQMALRSSYRPIASGPEKSRTRTCAERGHTPTYQKRIAEIESDVRLLRVARAFEVDLQRLRPEAKRGSAGSQSRTIATCAGCSSPARWPSSDMRANTARGGPGSLA